MPKPPMPPTTEASHGSAKNAAFRRQEVQGHVGLDRQAAQPLAELAYHQASGNRSRIDRGLGRAGAGMRFRGREQGRRIEPVRSRTGDGEEKRSTPAVVRTAPAGKECDS